MKNRFIPLIIVLILISGILITSSYMKELGEKDIYGVWEGVQHETELSFIFNTDGTCLLSFRDSVTGETNELRGTFELNFSKDPIPLSIRNIPQINHGLYTIVRFTSNDSLIIADFAPRWRLRPISFEYDTSMNLRRVDDNRI